MPNSGGHPASYITVLLGVVFRSILWMGFCFIVSIVAALLSIALLNNDPDDALNAERRYIDGVFGASQTHESVLTQIGTAFIQADQAINAFSRTFDNGQAHIELHHAVTTLLHLIQPAVLVFGSKVVSLTLFSLPLFAFVGLGVVDGLVQRYRRTARAGRESAPIYHAIKRMIVPSVAWLALLYLASPFPISPHWIFASLLLTLPVMVLVLISRFKKYV